LQLAACVTGGWGEKAWETDCREAACQSSRKSQFGGTNPAVRVHALLLEYNRKGRGGVS